MLATTCWFRPWLSWLCSQTRSCSSRYIELLVDVIFCGASTASWLTFSLWILVLRLGTKIILLRRGILDSSLEPVKLKGFARRSQSLIILIKDDSSLFVKDHPVLTFPVLSGSGPCSLTSSSPTRSLSNYQRWAKSLV